MLRLKETGFSVLPEQKILRAEEYAAYAQADTLVSMGQAEADRIIEEAKAAYEAEKVRGFSEGEAAGKTQIAEHMVDYVARIVANLQRFEVKLVDMLMQALHQIIGEIDNKELIIGVVSKALQVVRSQKRVMIRVAPSDLSTVEDQLNGYLERYHSINFLDVSSDDRLKPGDCMLETDVGVVDGRIEQQLEVIRKSLERWVK